MQYRRGPQDRDYSNIGIALFLDQDRRSLVHQFKQLDDVGVAHANAAVTVGAPDLVFMSRSVNVNETLARVRIVFIQSSQPENARRDQIFRGRQWVLRFERNPASKNGAERHAVPDFFRDLETAEGRFVASFFRPESEA